MNASTFIVRFSISYFGQHVKHDRWVCKYLFLIVITLPLPHCMCSCHVNGKREKKSEGRKINEVYQRKTNKQKTIVCVIVVFKLINMNKRAKCEYWNLYNALQSIFE